MAMLHLECCIGGLPQLVHQVGRVLLQQLLHGRLVKALWDAQPRDQCWLVLGAALAPTASGLYQLRAAMTWTVPPTKDAHLLEQGVHGPQYPRDLPDG